MMPLPWRRLLPALLALLAIQCSAARADQALIAVAANFKATAEALVAEFEASSDHELIIVSGSTGKLYTQIVNGAPYDVFLAADSERPMKLHEAGASVHPPRTYASGQIGIWIRGSSASDQHTDRLIDLRRIALANPSLAPYGAAAIEVIDRLTIRDKLADRLAYGENVAQAYALVAAGAAEGGLIAWSLLSDGGKIGESWRVPTDWHAPIDQDAVLLPHGAENPAAIAFYDYLYSADARALIQSRGYRTGASDSSDRPDALDATAQD